MAKERKLSLTALVMNILENKPEKGFSALTEAVLNTV